MNSRSALHRKWAVLILDTGVAFFASLLAILFVRWMVEPVAGFQHDLLLWVIVSTMVSLLSFLIFGTYRIVIRHSSYRSIGRLCLATIFKDLLLVGLLLVGLFKIGTTDRGLMVIAADFVLTLLSLILVRAIIISLFYAARRDDIAANVGKLGLLVFGTNDKAVSMLLRLESSSHYNVLGFITNDKSIADQVIHDRKVYYVPSPQALSDLKIRLGAEGILCAPSSVETIPEEFVSTCISLGLHILSSPRIDEVKFGTLSQEAAKDLNIKSDDYIPDGMTSFERNVKRIIDCIIAGLLLIFFSPLFLFCLLAIKIGDGGPAIYKQERIGRFGRPFKIYKFRSMRLDAESSGPSLYSGDDDPRLTKVGKFLRRHHLDELPQLWNVFIGQMAFVGYRPERKYYIDQIMEEDPRYYYLYQIRPGVTSYATLHNGYTDSMDKMLKRLEFDLYYLRHRSWWFDVKILFSTFTNIVFGKVF